MIEWKERYISRKYQQIFYSLSDSFNSFSPTKKGKRRKKPELLWARGRLRSGNSTPRLGDLEQIKIKEINTKKKSFQIFGLVYKPGNNIGTSKQQAKKSVTTVHIAYPLQFIVGKNGWSVPYDDIQPQILEIFHMHELISLYRASRPP